MTLPEKKDESEDENRWVDDGALPELEGNVLVYRQTRPSLKVPGHTEERKVVKQDNTVIVVRGPMMFPDRLPPKP